MTDIPKIGVCLFDDTRNAMDGWAAISGDKAQRIGGTHQLANDVFWVTNLNFPELKRLNLHRSFNIADNQYFRASVPMLIGELGLGRDAERACEVLATIFSRVVGEAKRHLGKIDVLDSYRFTKNLTDRLLTREQRATPSGPNAQMINDAIQQCMQANQGMSGIQRPSGSMAYGFAFPRGAYSRWILSQLVPGSSKWQEITPRKNETTVFGIEDGKSIQGTKAIVKRLNELAEGHALILKVTVVGIEPFHKPFATFGVSAMRPRGWACLPEILEMAKYSKIAIHGGFRTPSSQLSIPGIDLDLDEYSFSRSLYMENLWVSLTQKVGSSKFDTALGAYLRAYDRIACGRAAAVFAQMQYTVGSYGTGRVVLFLRPGEVSEACSIALENGLIPTLDIIQGG